MCTGSTIRGPSRCPFSSSPRRSTPPRPESPQIPGSFHSGIVLILATPPKPEPLNPARPLRVTFPSFLPCKPLEGTKPPPAPWARPCRPEPGLRRLRPSRELRRLHCCTPHTSSPAGLNQVNSTAVRHLRQESYMIYSS